MDIKEAESNIIVLEAELAGLDAMDPHADGLRLQIDHLREEVMVQLGAWDTVYLACHSKRPKTADYIQALLPDFVEPHDDHYYGDDAICQGGIVAFHERSVAVLIQSRGKTLEENIQRNFGMLHPEGYRKAIRLAGQAEKFHRPIIALADTAGAYPGKGVGEHGQAEAIAQYLAVFSEVHTPALIIILSEGGNGGALAFSVADYIMMLEHVIYPTPSSEGFASILWKDESRAAEVVGVMGLTTSDLKHKSIIDTIITKPKGGTHICFDYVAEHPWEQLENVLDDLCKKEEKVLLARRYGKYRMTGANYEEL